MDRSDRPATLVRDGAGLEALIGDLAERIAAEGARRASSGGEREFRPRLVGIRTRGVPLAERLSARLGELTGEAPPVGALDITLYRDDLDQSARWPIVNGTNIPFDVEDAEIVLVDDVLFTGRTTRAALNAICDLGRPRRVWLAVAVERGEHRELPIHADFAGLRLETRRDERVLVRIGPIDGDEGILVAGV